MKHSLAGVLAVLFALATSELAAGLCGTPSVLASVGERIILLLPERLEELVVAWLGFWDKPLFIALMVAICTGLGALLGRLARRTQVPAIIGFTLFGAVGAYAADTVLPVVIPTVLGLAVEMLLTAERPPDQERRAFIAVAALAVVSLISGRWLLAGRLKGFNVALPPPVETVPPPAPGTQVKGIGPIVTPTDKFYRVDTLLDAPYIPPDTWSLKIDGLVDTPLTITWDELLQYPMVERYVTLTCVSNEVGGDLVGNARWQGVLLADILKKCGVQPTADLLVSRSQDGYTVAFPLERLADARTALIAVGMNGQPLTPEHGFPARLLVVGMYGYVSATKWLRHIQLSTMQAFEARPNAKGLHTMGPIKTQSRIDTPARNQQIPAGARTLIAGVAWAQHRGIRKVEVQIDDGPWREATLAEELHIDSWRQWSLEWAADAGVHTIRVRATDATGTLQTEEKRRPAPDGATGWHTITVTVT